MNFELIISGKVYLPVSKQIYRMMKLVTFFMTCCLMQVSALTSAQVTIRAKNAAFRTVLEQISSQSGRDLIYVDQDLKLSNPVSLELTNVPIEQALKRIFERQPLQYELADGTIMIKRKRTIQKLETPTGESPDQQQTISGKVLDENNKPIANVTVKVKGTNTVVQTNSNGDFILQGQSRNLTLHITYLGYQDQEVKANSGSYLQIKLSPLSQNLEEVAVISTGYQTLKKSQLTGAYASIDRETYQQNIPVSGNIVSNMEGKLAGLMLNVNQSRNQWSDRSNTSPFVIRGVSTFQAIKKPLIVLNGYPTEVDIESINPYDIESVTILKDAASAAIYGVRASNGVVVINTRKGSQGRPKVSFTTAISASPKANYDKLNLLSGRGYIDFERASGLNDIENNFLTKDYIDQLNGSYTPVFSITDDLYHQRITEAEAEQRYNELATYDNTDDYKRLFLQNPLYQTYDLNVSGGSSNATYFFGVNHQNNQFEERFSGFNKTNINFRGTFNFSNRVSLDVQNVYSMMNTKQASIPNYLDFKPYQPFLNADGSAVSSYFSPYNMKYYGFGENSGTINAERNKANMEMGLYDVLYYPYQEMFESGLDGRNQIYRGQGNLKVNLLPGLDFELGGIYELGQGQHIFSASEKAYETRIMLNYFAQPDPITGKPIFKIPQGGTNRTEDSKTSAYTLRSQLTYNKILNEKHDLAVLLGVEQRKNTNSNRLNTVFGYNSNILSIKPADLSLLANRNYYPAYTNIMVSGLNGYAIDQSTFNDFFNETYQDDRFISSYTNVAYTYNHKYSATGSLRIDQSNLFGEDPKFRYTPLWSAGLSWNIRKEDFMQAITWMDELKLRVAGGYNGNIKKGSGPFNLLTAEVNNYPINSVIGYRITSPRNDELGWEKTLNLNAGLDFSFFEQRVSGSVDYYIKRGTDIFSPIESDPTLGFTNLLTNNASIENKGLDINISTTNIKREAFSWRTQLTGSFNRSMVLKVRNTYNGFLNFSRAGGAENIEGHPMNSVLTLEYLGLNEAGLPMVKDENGNPIILGWSPKVDVPLSAMKFAGVNDPKYVLGLNNQVGFKQFNLSALLMYYGGHVGLISPPNIFDPRPVAGIQDFWKKPGDEKFTEIPGFGGPYGSDNYIQAREGYSYASKFVRKMDFIALRNITLTYHIPERAIQNLGLSNTKVLFQVQNPAKYVFSGNDVDPETLDFVRGKRGLPTAPFYTFSLSTNF